MDVPESWWLVEAVRTHPAHSEARRAVEGHAGILEGAAVIL